MDRKQFLDAAKRFLEGDRPFKYVTPDWYAILDDGQEVPLKYVYAMALGSGPTSRHTEAAKDAAEHLNLKIVNRALLPASRSRYWWVNHKQTSKVELEGGYIWSPTAKKNGARNQAYVNLTLVRQGDIVISYAGTLIKAIGVATGHYVDSPKPDNYGSAGDGWDGMGWKVPVEWTLLEHPLRPKDYLDQLVPLLPQKYSPLQVTGDGNQSIYLASISIELGRLILSQAAMNSRAAVEQIEALETNAEEETELERIAETDLTETEKEQIVRSRRGQGLFRLNVLKISPRCLLTGVTDQNFLIASHIKPWRDCDNRERLDGHNGLMLAPHVDKLFDRGWITFADSGSLMIAPLAVSVAEAWGLTPSISTAPFSEKQKKYLQFHRDHIFKGKNSS